MEHQERVTVVVGGQYGSEGKGAVVGKLHRERRYESAVRVGGPNAGHSVVDDDGRKFALRQIPVAAAIDPDCQLFIAAGSEVDPDVVKDECEMLEEAGHRVSDRLWIDSSATLLQPKHAEAEAELRHGTTGKGIGGARADRALRGAKLMKDYDGELWWRHTEVEPALRQGTVMLEGTQGFALGTREGHYPYCTSGNCRAIDMLAAAGMAPQAVETWVVLRTYPIRIAGDSGPLFGETSWEVVGVPPEFTTVTKKMRRVGMWDERLARRSVLANRDPGRPLLTRVALTFADYWWPELAGAEELGESALGELAQMEKELDCRVSMVGTGPATQVMRPNYEMRSS